MNRSKRIYALLGVLVVLCAATFAMTKFEEKQEKIRTSDEIVLEIPKDSVTALSWVYSDEESTLAFHKEEGTWVYDEDAAFPVSEEKVMDILSHFESFGVTFAIEDVEDYAQYGLDKPKCTIHVSAGEEDYAIKLGDFSTMDSQRYVDIGDGNVFLVGEDPMDYFDSNLSSMILNDDTPSLETVDTITFAGDENYTITFAEDSPDTYSDDDTYFVTRDGKNVPLDTSRVRRYLNTITSLDLSSYVTYDATQEELETFGLDEPDLSVTVNYTQTGEDEVVTPSTITLHISRNPEELAAAEAAEAKGEEPAAVTRYVRIGDSQIVYELNSADYAILSDASYNDLRHREVIWADLDDMTRMDISLDGETYTLTSVDDDDERQWYYGLPAEETPEETTDETAAEDPALDMTAFQDALKALTADSFTEEAPAGKKEISLTIHLDNENFQCVQIDLYRYDGESCLAVVDGETVSLVPRASVVDLIEAVNTIVL